MEPQFQSKVAIVTGGSRGIGLAIAGDLARAGASVAITGLTSSHLQTARSSLAEIAGSDAHVEAMQADVSDPEQAAALVKRVIERFGGLDILINNAGGLVDRVPIGDIDDAFFDAVIDLNVRSLVAACSAAVPHMRKAGGGNVVNVTSVAARTGGGSGAVMYAAAKGFVSTFTRGLAKEVVKDRIRVNAVSPGVIVTPFHERYSTPAMLESFKATIPMNRLGTADECAGAFLYLASDALSGFVTGQILEVNGGQVMP
jgi:3-oxoacyl-[acyl-carrier protein] reductase